MIKNIIKKETKENLWKLIIGTIFLLVTALIAIFSHDFILDFLSDVSLDGYERFIPDINILYNDTLYIWSQWNAKNLYQIGAILAIIFGMSQIAGEVNSNSIGFLLTKPLSRRKIYFSKALAGIINLSIAIIIPTISLLLLANYIFDNLAISSLIVVNILTLLGLILIYSLSLFCSTIIDDPIKAGIITAIIVIAFSIPGWFQVTKRLSLSTYIKGEQYILNNQFPYIAALIIMILTLMLLNLGARIFEKKDY